jgi:methyl halide transferase
LILRRGGKQWNMSVSVSKKRTTMPITPTQSSNSSRSIFATTPDTTTTVTNSNSSSHILLRPQNPNDKVMVNNLRDRFQTHDSETAADVWESLWKDEMTPWDLGGPTKVLLSELTHKLQQQEQEQQSSSWWLPRHTMSLIPGCGSGHDVVSLARYFDARTTTTDGETDDCGGTTTTTVVGLELSPTSLEKARHRIEDSLEKEGPFVNRTTICLCHGDFFHPPSQWTTVYTTHTPTKEGLSSSDSLIFFSDDQTFDFIFDYTFFCAIPPTLRPTWGEQMGKLIASPHGKLLTLMFPYHHHHDAAAVARKNESVSLEHARMKDETQQQKGPPYLVSVHAYRDVLERTGLCMETPTPYASASTVAQRRGQEFVGWWSKSTQSSSKL